MDAEVPVEAGELERAPRLSAGAASRNARWFGSFVRASISTPSAVESTNATSESSTTIRSGSAAASVSKASRTSCAL